MAGNRLGIALIGEEVLDMELPSSITSHATSLVLESSREQAGQDIARLIRDCSNLRTLRVATSLISDLASCIPCTLTRLAHLLLYSPRSAPSDLSQLIRRVPNVESIGSLPPASAPLDGDLGPLGPRVLDYLALFQRRNTLILLRSLIMHGWNVRTIVLSVSPPVLQVLNLLQFELGIGSLPAARELSLYIEDSCSDETDALCTLIAACHLRRLILSAPTEKTAALLTAALGHCGGLRALGLNFEDFTPSDAVQGAVDALLGALPRTLRSLDVSILALDAPVFAALRRLCLTRRISFTIGSDMWDT